MATVQVMPEHWSALNAARRQRQKCSEDVAELKRLCEKECGKRHVIECESCYAKVLSRMRQRYSESQEMEWFSQRRMFLHELEGLFNDVKDHLTGLNTIEASIESEKEAWYRWVLRKNPEFLEMSENNANQEELRGLLDDPDRSRDELVAMMWQGVGKPDDWASKVDALAEKVAAVREDGAALKELYISKFFLDANGEVLKNAKPYLEQYQSNDTVSLEEVISTIANDNRQSRSSQPLRDSHAKRLDELRRAKTAFEQNRLRAKGLLNQAQSAAKEELYNIPPCAVCQGAVPHNDVISCSLCQAIMQMGRDQKLVVYCSETCYEAGQDKHAEREHDCAAGDQCVQVFDEDGSTQDGFMDPVACRDCFESKKFTLFCSERCATRRISDHLQSEHGVKSDPDEVKGLLVPLAKMVRETLTKENPGLELVYFD